MHYESDALITVQRFVDEVLEGYDFVTTSDVKTSNAESETCAISPMKFPLKYDLRKQKFRKEKIYLHYFVETKNKVSKVS